MKKEEIITDYKKLEKFSSFLNSISESKKISKSEKKFVTNLINKTKSTNKLPEITYFFEMFLNIHHAMLHQKGAKFKGIFHCLSIQLLLAEGINIYSDANKSKAIAKIPQNLYPKGQHSSFYWFHYNYNLLKIPYDELFEKCINQKEIAEKSPHKISQSVSALAPDGLQTSIDDSKQAEIEHEEMGLGSDRSIKKYINSEIITSKTIKESSPLPALSLLNTSQNREPSAKLKIGGQMIKLNDRVKTQTESIGRVTELLFDINRAILTTDKNEEIILTEDSKISISPIESSLIFS